MRKYLLFFVASMLATVARASDGDIFSYEGLSYKVISEEEHSVGVYNGRLVAGNISIPSYAVNGSSRYFVTEILDGAFQHNTSLISITIPSSVVKIGETVLSGCSKMTEITVDNGNPNYMSDNGVLFNIDKTTLIQYPGGKKGGYDIPNSVTKIEDGAFTSTFNLSSVTIPGSVTEIG